MKHRILGITTVVLTTGLAAQKTKPPQRTTGIAIGKKFDVEIEYSALLWDPNGNPGVFGTMKTKRPVRIGGRDIDKGTYRVSVERDPAGGWHFGFSTKKRSDPKHMWRLDADTAAPIPRLELVCSVDVSERAFLNFDFGTKHLKLSMASTEEIEARLKKDAAIQAIDAQVKKVDTSSDDWRTKTPKPNVVDGFDPEREYRWNLMTDRGLISLRLFPKVAPMHVTSTIYLTRAGFYDGLVFHRVIDGFMAQGGCSLGTGSGACGYTYGGEFDPKVRHDRPGLLSMANAGPDTDGSQFFITFREVPDLDDKHTIFGEVVHGMEVVDFLNSIGTQGGEPKVKVVIESATVSIE